ncbi:Tol-Pal system protein TolB, partial [Tateyamaria sp.]|nr:Tol-Pal system protein TolB [Tateyamaria sp.]
MMVRVLFVILVWLGVAPAVAQTGPLRIEITEGVIEPLPVAIPDLVAETARSVQMGQQIARVIAADLTGTGLFREVPSSA